MSHNKLTLTATTCLLLEDLRFALEVLKESPVRFKHLELENGLTSGRGVFYVGKETFSVLFSRGEPRVLKIILNNDGHEEEHKALYSSTVRQVSVLTVIGHTLRWIEGTSARDTTMHFCSNLPLNKK